MNTEILDKKYTALKEDIEKYYNRIISNQKEPLVINEDLHYIVDYLDQNTGLYCEAFVRQLTTIDWLEWRRKKRLAKNNSLFEKQDGFKKYFYNGA